jgi:isocitrate/isopropylmalate dehydrogenase
MKRVNLAKNEKEKRKGEIEIIVIRETKLKIYVKWQFTMCKKDSIIWVKELYKRDKLKSEN